MPRLEHVLADLAAVPGARAAAFAGLDGLLVDEVAAASGGLEDVDLDRASAEHLAGGVDDELLLSGPRGVVVARLVADRWFAFLWAEPDVDLATARAALARAAGGLAEVVE